MKKGFLFYFICSAAFKQPEYNNNKKCFCVSLLNILCVYHFELDKLV